MEEQREVQDKGYPANFTELTRIGLFAQTWSGVELTGSFYAVHKPGDIMDMLGECFTAWFRTPEGRDAYRCSGGYFMIENLLDRSRPDDAFTKKYGFMLIEYAEDIPEDRDFCVHETEAYCDSPIGDWGRMPQ